MPDIYDFISQKILKIIEERDIKSVCDYGCGEGQLLKLLKKQIPQPISLTGIDYFSKFRDEDRVHKTTDGIHFVEKDSDEFKKLSDENKFDLIISTFALHHYQYPILELQTIYEMLTDNGIIYIIDLDFKNENKAQIVTNYFSFINEFLSSIKGRFHRHHYTLKEALDLLKGVKVNILYDYESKYDEKEKERRENSQDFLKRNERSINSLEKAPPIYRKIFSQLFRLKQELIEEFQIEFSSLFTIVAQKRL